MKTILTFLFVFGVIVIVHEFGHFLFAKLSGILVREFSIGMGPKLFSHKSTSGTTYTIRLLPLGGYVRMAGAGEEEMELSPGQPISLELNQAEVVSKINTSKKVQLPNSVPMEVVHFDLEDDLYVEGYLNGDESSLVRYAVDHDASIIEEDGIEVQIAPRDVQFQSAKLYQRILTNFAGPLFNFILTFVLFTLVIFMQGGDAQPDTSNKIGGVVAGGIAEKAGIKPDDRILAINGQATPKFIDIQKQVTKQADKKTAFLIERDGSTKTMQLTPKTVKQKDGSKAVLIGIQGGLKVTPLSFGQKIQAAGQKTWQNATALFIAVKGLFTSFSLNKLGGPVMIFQLSHEVAQSGLITILNFMAFLSINLGIMNLLPIPALDGGKLVFNILEGIRRKPLSPESEGKVTLVGFAFLMLLMVLVTWNDIMRFFFR